MKRSTNFNSKRKVRRVASSAAGIADAVRIVGGTPEEAQKLLQSAAAAFPIRRKRADG